MERRRLNWWSHCTRWKQWLCASLITSQYACRQFCQNVRSVGQMVGYRDRKIPIRIWIRISFHKRSHFCSWTRGRLQRRSCVFPRLYLNGQLDGTTAKNLNTQMNSSGFQIGLTPSNDGWHQYFSGAIDELYAYNRALEQDEIRQLISTVHRPIFVRISDLQHIPTPPNPIKVCGRIVSESPLKISDGNAAIEISGIVRQGERFYGVDWQLERQHFGCTSIRNYRYFSLMREGVSQKLLYIFL